MKSPKNFMKTVISILRATFYKVKLIIWPDVSALDEIAKREKSCAKCIFNSKNLEPEYKTKRPDAHCVICGCNLALKVFDLHGSCAIKKWNKTTGLNLDVRWDSYPKPTVDGKSKDQSAVL